MSSGCIWEYILGGPRLTRNIVLVELPLDHMVDVQQRTLERYYTISHLPFKLFPFEPAIDKEYHVHLTQDFVASTFCPKTLPPPPKKNPLLPFLCFLAVKNRVGGPVDRWESGVLFPKLPSFKGSTNRQEGLRASAFVWMRLTDGPTVGQPQVLRFHGGINLQQGIPGGWAETKMWNKCIENMPLKVLNCVLID